MGTLELHERVENWETDDLVWEEGRRFVAIEPLVDRFDYTDPEAIVHVYSSCCGCNYDFTRERAEQLRDYLTKMLEDKDAQ